MLAICGRLLPMTSAEPRLRITVLVDELLVAERLLERVEVGALNVLDDGKLERLLVGDVMNDDRHVVQAGLLRRPPAPLAGDDLVGLRGAAGGGRTRIGWTTPFSRIEAASSSRSRRVVALARIARDWGGGRPPAGGAGRDSGPSPKPRPRHRRSARPARDRAGFVQLLPPSNPPCRPRQLTNG